MPSDPMETHLLENIAKGHRLSSLISHLAAINALGFAFTREGDVFSLVNVMVGLDPLKAKSLQSWRNPSLS
jgi:hypothetical protein